MATLPTNPAAQSPGPIVFTPRGASEPIVVPASAHSHEGFREWVHSRDFPERGKITYVENQLHIDMSPAAYNRHGEIIVELVRVLSQLVRDRALGKIYSENSLITNKEAGVSNEPDLLFISHATRSSGRARIARPNEHGDGIEMVGTVDWVCEVVSPSSVAKDKVKLRKAYYEAGIGEYWIIDARGEDIEFLLLTPGPEGYEEAAADDGWLASPTFGRSFRLNHQRAADGLFEWTLESK